MLDCALGVVVCVVKSDVALLLLEWGLLGCVASALGWGGLKSLRRLFEVVDGHVGHIGRRSAFFTENTLHARMLIVTVLEGFLGFV